MTDSRPTATPIGDDDLQAFIDGRLGGDRLVAIEAHLAANPEMAAQIARDRQQRDGLRAALQATFTEPLPPRLRISQIRAARRQRMLRQLCMAAALGFVLLAGATGGWLARGALMPASQPAAGGANAVVALGFTRDALAAYRIFVVEKRHAVEVDADQETHLIAWLSKRLGRPLQAPMLDAFGFHLMGGRLLPATEADDAAIAAAQFMYEGEDGRRMTLYVRAGSGAETAFRFQQSGDAATFAWIDQGFGFALTAATDRAALLPIAEAVYHAYEATAGGG